MQERESSLAREDRLDRPPPSARGLLWLAGALSCLTFMQAQTAQAQTRAVNLSITPTEVHPAFAAKLADRRGFRADDHTQEDACPGTGDLQHVRDYDGTLGQTRAFVDAHENPVGILNPVGCSGTLVASNLYLTASHCVDDLTPGSDTVTFEFEKLAGSTGTATTSVFTVTRLVQDGADSGLDFAVLELNGTPGNTFGVTQLEEFTPAVSHLLTIIQHPARQRKQVEVGHVHSFTSNTIRYNDLDTAGGSSGSGILDDHGRLVGVHTNGGCEAGGENFGTRMDRILANSEVLRNLLPPSFLAVDSTVQLLRVHDVGTMYGPPGDAIDAEAIIQLAATGSDAYGFTLRTGTDQATHRGMFRLLLDAYRTGRVVHVEYDRETHRTSRIVRVVRN